MIYIGQSLTATSEQCAKLEWQDIINDFTVGYNVYMAYGASGTPELVATNLTKAEWVSPPLRPDRNYTFYVTSLTSNGKESDLSAPLYFNHLTVDPVIVEPTKTTLVVPANSKATITLPKTFSINFEVSL